MRYKPDGSPDNTFGVGGRARANFGPAAPASASREPVPPLAFDAAGL